MRGSLSVRVTDRDVTRIVTAKTRDLRFRKTAPGGHHSASCRLILPRDTFRDLGPADRLYIYDSRTARTIWEGYTENPGVTDGSGGQEFDLTAMGGMVLANDRSETLIYADSDYTKWTRADDIASAPSATTEFGTRPTDAAPALFMQFVPGQPVAAGYQARMLYLPLEQASMQLGAFTMTRVEGKTDAAYSTDVQLYTGVLAGGQTPLTQTATTTASTITQYAVTNFDAGKTRIAVRLRRTGGATNVADDNTWLALTGVRVLGRPVDKTGVLRVLTSAAGILASDVAGDLVGRVLTMCDGATSTIETTTTLIDQLAYHDGAKAAQVLDDLALHEPDFLWEILETGSSGKHRFNYRAWPTTPRYEISVRDGYNAPGGEVDLCNRIAVYWTDEKGAKRTTVVTQTVDALGTRIRDAEPVTLPDGQGSLANAQRVGAQVLASKANPPKAATAVVKRPILDRLTGMTVMPWEIEPGYLVRVRETGDDLRLTEMEYVDQDCSAALTLGTPVRSLEQMVADLSRSR